MKLTQAHFDFYRQKKAPVPKWASLIKTPDKPVNIHTLINSQTEVKTRSTEPHNLISLIKGAKRIIERGETRWSTLQNDELWPYKSMREFLYHMAFTPYSSDPKRRTAYARKWYIKLYRKGNDEPKTYSKIHLWMEILLQLRSGMGIRNV